MSLTILPRRLISVFGKDAPTFLQGLCTNDVLQFASPESLEKRASVEADEGGSASWPSLYTMFLDARGRTLFDCIIVHAEGNEGGDTAPHFFLDCHKDDAKALHRHLSLHRLRVDVKVDITDDFAVALPRNADDGVQVSEENKAARFADPRLKALGERILVSAPGSGKDVESMDFIEDAGFSENLMLKGIIEGPPLRGRIPLECNLDKLGGVSFDKGCYMGQELVARTHFRGQVRKRCLPMTFKGDAADVEAGAKIFVSEKEVGKVVDVRGSAGVGMFRLAHVLDESMQQIKDPLQTLVQVGSNEDRGSVECEVAIPSFW
eukprot:g3982.t1